MSFFYTPPTPYLSFVCVCACCFRLPYLFSCSSFFSRLLLPLLLLLLYNSTAASAFALLAPHLLETIAHQHGFAVPQPALLVFPLISVMGAAVAALAYLETQALGARAVSRMIAFAFLLLLLFAPFLSILLPRPLYLAYSFHFFFFSPSIYDSALQEPFVLTSHSHL